MRRFRNKRERVNCAAAFRYRKKTITPWRLIAVDGQLLMPVNTLFSIRISLTRLLNVFSLAEP